MMSLSPTERRRPTYDAFHATRPRWLFPVESGLSSRLDDLRRIKPRRRLVGAALLFADALICLFALLLAQILRQGAADLDSVTRVLCIVFPIYFLVALQTGAHNPTIAHKPSNSILSAAAAFLITAALFFFGLYVIKSGANVSRIQAGLVLALCGVFGGASRYAISRYSQGSLGGTPHADLYLYDDVPLPADRPRGGIRATDVGLVPDLNQPAMVRRLGELVRGMDRLIVCCSPARRELWARALRCVDIRSEIVVPELSQLKPLGVRYRSGEFALVLANGPLRWHQRWSKNLFDFAFASVILLTAMPLIALIALAVRLEDGGPALFGQERIGLGNRPFRIWKFRTMRTEAADHLGAVSTTRDDGRITRVGRILRSTSLDELPQLFNVLAGQMSIVGPRPHAPASRAEEHLFWDIDERYWHRHSVRPGITGLAQVRGLRGTTEHLEDLERRLHADLEYVANWSLWQDLRIICSTFSVLIHRNAF